MLTTTTKKLVVPFVGSLHPHSFLRIIARQDEVFIYFLYINIDRMNEYARCVSVFFLFDWARTRLAICIVSCTHFSWKFILVDNLKNIHFQRSVCTRKCRKDSKDFFFLSYVWFWNKHGILECRMWKMGLIRPDFFFIVLSFSHFIISWKNIDTTKKYCKPNSNTHARISAPIPDRHLAEGE